MNDKFAPARPKGISGRRNASYKSPFNQGANPFHVNDILGDSFAHLGIAAKIREHNIKKSWAECVGENISRRASPQKLVGDTLYCLVSSSPWMTELNYQKHNIIDKVNNKLGQTAVTDIIFRIGQVNPGAAPCRPPEKRAKAELTERDRRLIDGLTEGLRDDTLKALIKKAFEKARS